MGLQKQPISRSRFGVHRSFLPCEVPTSSFINFRPKTCVYVVPEEPVKLIARQTLTTFRLRQDFEHVVDMEHLHHGHPPYPSQQEVYWVIWHFLG
jgi:hypothetical protein